MEKMQIIVDGKNKTIEADIKIGRGMYAVTESNIAKRNAEKLLIRFDDSMPGNVLQNRISKIEKWAFLTSKAANQYAQYIFMPSASQEDFNSFLENIDDTTMRQMLTDTFNMTRLRFDNLDILSNLGKSKN